MFDEDLSEFLDVDEFADSATISPRNLSTPFNVVGIFDSRYIDAKIADGDLETGSPVFRCKSIDVAGKAIRGDSLAVKGKQFAILRVEPDGTGMTMLALTED